MSYTEFWCACDPQALTLSSLHHSSSIYKIPRPHPTPSQRSRQPTPIRRELLCRKKVKKVEYSSDERSILVSFTTGKLQRLFLPYDPDLFPKLLEMKVEIDYERGSLGVIFLEGLARVRRSARLEPVLPTAD